ncbi:type II toxin-antitoxin system VapC family toxin [Halostagnicola larsenii]|uniref:type II toxin-antitoxin system VapC family toxin n=1 Tax=Halostagnicola larsenii TaxID=353800 RepID=UPI001F55B93C|nr:PIN domain-containing protein [Halostagnicola larsenii]
MHDRDSARHDVALEAVTQAATGEYGRLFTSEYVYDETVTLVRQRTGQFSAAKQAGDRIRGVEPYPKTFEMLHVTEALFDRTLETFQRYDDQSLSFTDANSLALIKAYDIDAICSFDDDFDGLAERTDPASI